MKRAGHKKVLGVSIGERSLMVAEVIAGPKPEVRHLGELVYPEGLSPAKPTELGIALDGFLKQQQISATHAVLGIPVRWLVAQTKDVPAADEATLTNILRLQAEAEFSTELKDLVYDYTSQTQNKSAASASVLLLATPRRYVDAAIAMCAAAELTPLAVTASAVVLGDLTAKSMSRAALVLSVGASGAEMTSPSGSGSSAIRHLRAPVPQGPFVNELRRMVSTLPNTSGTHEMILWDGVGLDSQELGGQLGFTIRNGELPQLGVDTVVASRNGEGRKFASAVALAVAGLDGQGPAVDFLHSRLAPPKPQLIPRWAVLTGLSVLLAILLGILAYRDLTNQQSTLARIQSELDAKKTERANAADFVALVSFAQGWHGGDPRYLACLRDITAAMTDERDTYATGLTLRETAKPGGSQSSSSASSAKAANPLLLTGVLSGKTSDQERVQVLLDHMRKVKGFVDVKLGSSNAARGHEVTFTINFSYLPTRS